VRMSDYYRSACAVRQLCEKLLNGLHPARHPSSMTDIGDGLGLRDDEVCLFNERLLNGDPALALRLYRAAVERDLQVSESARLAIARAASSPEFGIDLRQDPSAASLFRELVCEARETRLRNRSVLAELHEVGLLLAMIPEFEPVVGRVHHDTYHVYTVDEHSVAAVDHLRKLVRGDLAQDHPLACRVAAEHVRRGVLFFATLLHDVGKVFGGVDHADRGAEMAEEILHRLRFSETEIHDIQLLIRLHLRMYHVATRRDLDDPETLRVLCSEVGERELLRTLYLLTVADVTTTSPTSMTRWKRRMLDELEIHADRFMARNDSAMRSPRIELARERIMSLWPTDLDRGFIVQFISGLPQRYFYANPPEVVVQHARFALDGRDQRCAVRLGGERLPYQELWVVAEDRPGLLALIAGALAQSKLRVLSAQVYLWVDENGQSRSLDAFWVRPRTEEQIGELDVENVRRHLERLMDGRADALGPPPSEPPPSSGSLVPRWLDAEAQVNIDNRSASHCTVVEVITRDQPYLLFTLAQTLQRMGLTIVFAKINTEGRRVADVFYLCEPNNEKISDPRRLDEIRQELLGTLQQEGDTAA
jgi:[protein-PII] uridylyltransferase